MAGLGVNKMKRPGQQVSGPAAPYTGGGQPKPPGYGGGPPTPAATMTGAPLSVSKVNKGARPAAGLGARPPVAAPSPVIRNPLQTRSDSSMGGNGYGGAVPGNTIDGNFQSVGGSPTIEDFQNWGQTVRPPGMPVPTPRPTPSYPTPTPRPAGGTQTARPGGRPDRNDLGRPAGGVRDFVDGALPGSPMGQGTMQYAPGVPGDRAMTGSDPFGYDNSGMRNNGFGSPGYGVNPGMSAGVDQFGNEIRPGSPQDIATGNDSGGRGGSGGGGSAGGGGGGGAPGGGTAGDPEARGKRAGLGARPPADATTRAAPGKKLPAKGATPDPATAAPADPTLATPPPAGTPDPSATATPPGAITAQSTPAPTGLNVGADDAATKANGNNQPPGRRPPTGPITDIKRDVNLEDVPDSTTVQDQLAGILDQDSVLNQQAQARGLQQANRRGLLNSSIAVNSAQAALYDAAVPIASQQAQLSQAEREAVLNRNQATTFKDWELRSADRNAAATYMSNMEQIGAQMYQAIYGNEKLGKGARARAIKDIQRMMDARRRAVEDMYGFNITF